MSDYRNWISSFIRIVKTDDQNNMTIYDILYDADLNKFFIVIDNTRNNSLTNNNQNISLKEFEQLGEYKNENILYLIAFNGTFSKDTFEDINTLIITKLN